MKYLSSNKCDKKNSIFKSIYLKKKVNKSNVKYCLLNIKYNLKTDDVYGVNRKPQKIKKILDIKFLNINQFSEKLFSEKNL